MSRPKVTVIFLSYNQEKYVAEALSAAMAQDLASYELVIADDASTDGTWSAILATLDSGKRECIEVKLLRQPSNRGIIGNFNDALSLATGEILVAMAGDDVSESSRVRRVVEAFASSPNIRVVTSQWIKVDQEGNPLGLGVASSEDKIFSFENNMRKGPFAGGLVIGACAAYHRSLYDIFGRLPADAGGEDIDYMFRALLIGEAYYLSEPLVRYRQHQANACNFEIRRLSLIEIAEREIRMVEAMSNADRQWNRDLERAHQLGLISDAKRAALSRVIEKFVLRHRLSALSLRVSPLEIWWKTALPLLRMGDFIKVLKLLWLRLSARRRRRHWEWIKSRK